MKISFVIPALNEERLIGACIRSIEAAAADYKRRNGDLDYEIVVVDNNSVDDTAKIAMMLGARVIGCQEQGLTRARQAGMLAARFPIHAYVDADVRIPPRGWIDNVRTLADNPDCVAISGPFWFDEQGPIARAAASAFTWFQRFAHATIGPTMQGGNYACKRDALIAAGGHPTGIDFFGEDTETARRLATVGVVKFTPAMWCNASARRFNAAGYAYTAMLYSLNYLSVHLGRGPLTKSHKNFRAS